MSFLEGPWNAFLVHPLIVLALIAYSVAHDFGLAIVLVTVAIRLVLYPLYITQIRSQRAMQELAPALNELKKRYGNDRQRISQEQMKLYAERGVNPAAGCLPLVLQMPILFALYAALTQLGCGLNHGLGASCTATLSHQDAQLLLPGVIPNPIPVGGSLDTTANWLPWISGGLQERDPYLILPIVAGVAQLIASVMAQPAKPSQTSDPNQRMMQSMAYTFPLMTVFLGASFPAGLTLYWTATTIFQIVQQYFVVGWGQLPRWLPFLRSVPSPADRDMRRREAAALAEERADMGEQEQIEAGAPVAEAQPMRRRGRRRGKR